jgi:hypothetical protein
LAHNGAFWGNSTYYAALSVHNEATEARDLALLHLVREDLLGCFTHVGEDATGHTEVADVALAEERYATGTGVVAHDAVVDIVVSFVGFAHGGGDEVDVGGDGADRGRPGQNGAEWGRMGQTGAEWRQMCRVAPAWPC